MITVIFELLEICITPWDGSYGISFGIFHLKNDKFALLSLYAFWNKLMHRIRFEIIGQTFEIDFMKPKNETETI
jgi:hypothetical protein